LTRRRRCCCCCCRRCPRPCQHHCSSQSFCSAYCSSRCCACSRTAHLLSLLAYSVTEHLPFEHLWRQGVGGETAAATTRAPVRPYCYVR
jgi:hypothetical protein